MNIRTPNGSKTINFALFLINLSILFSSEILPIYNSLKILLIYIKHLLFIKKMFKVIEINRKSCVFCKMLSIK